MIKPKPYYGCLFILDILNISLLTYSCKLICAIIILVVLSDILPDKTHCFDYKNYNYIFQSKARKCPSIRNKILTAFAAADVLTRRV